ncbi:protein PROCA1 [Emydura macquarii macquarii]|uniref:protein PROCA1 n=1 Tax=Emydura macquarii macquarii TaxID=1129001 RepID=UPI00352AA986
MRALALRLLCLLAAARGTESPGQPGPACAPRSSPAPGRAPGGRPLLGATWAPGRGQGAARRRAKRGFTYPGTLWCGAGSNADSYEQLGDHRETDRCCREHDHCPHVIHPFTYNYGFRNLRWHTISHCDCDRGLKGCLRQVNDTASRVVGQAFFNVIQVPCFEFTYKEQCVEPYLYIWCKKYNTVAIAVPREPVLYEFGGDLIDEVAAGPTQSGRAPSSPVPQPHTPQPRESTGRWAPPPTKQPLPGPAVTEAVDSFHTSKAPGPRPESPTKGKGKKRGRKKKKGKGLKKKKAPPKAEVLGLPAPPAAAASLLPKHVVLGHEPLDKTLDFGGKEAVFNAILNDAPLEEATLTPPSPAPAESHAWVPWKAGPFPTLQPTFPAGSRKRRRERNGRKRPRKKAESLPGLRETHFSKG